MPGLEDPVPTSSPLSGALSSSASKEDALAFYKAQYEQLEAELADFQTSSRELEAELEKDVEEAEKRERTLKEKVEALSYEVDEWKSKCKQSKSEANDAQNKLQKEITTLRDHNRTLQLKLRDIEVQNDDFERQARNTSSSLEDMESKYNVAIERGVILEGEVKEGEQERESLRIEVQRLRDELSDLKVEAEIRQDKLRNAEAASKLRKPTPLAATIPRPRSSISEHSPTATTSSSPTIATPPTKSVSSATSDAPTPPSPPTSDKSNSANTTTPANAQPKSRLSITNSATPRPLHYSARPPRHSRGGSSNLVTPSNRRTTLSRGESSSITNSASLTQIRGLIGKMQKLEQRVQSARSKLPAPTSTPPRGSPRPGSSMSDVHIPSTVTMRSSRKRTSASNNSGSSALAVFTTGGADGTLDSSVPPSTRSGTRASSRLSSGMIPPPTPTKDIGLNTGVSRPSSRASLSSRQSISHLPRGVDTSSRPSSRASATGARTPLGHYPTNAERIVRPRSSIGGSYTHGPTTSVSRLSNYGMEESPDATEKDKDVVTPTPSRRTTFGKADGATAIPMPSAKRNSGVGAGTLARRSSSGQVGDMGPPPERKKKLADLGETY